MKLKKPKNLDDLKLKPTGHEECICLGCLRVNICNKTIEDVREMLKEEYNECWCKKSMVGGIQVDCDACIDKRRIANLDVK